MGVAHLNGPPDCPEAAHWCIACLMDAKQKHWEMSETDRNKAYAAGGDHVVWIPWPAALTRELRPGTYRGVCGELPMLGIVDGLCWDHMAGTNPTSAPSGLVQAPGPLPPRLRGKKG